MQVIEVAFNEGAANLIPNYVRQYQPNHPVGSANNFTALNYLQTSVMTPGYVPKMVFIDRSWMIRVQHSGEDPFFSAGNEEKNIRATLDGLLKTAPAAKKQSPVRRKKS